MKYNNKNISEVPESDLKINTEYFDMFQDELNSILKNNIKNSDLNFKNNLKQFEFNDSTQDDLINSQPNKIQNKLKDNKIFVKNKFEDTDINNKQILQINKVNKLNKINRINKLNKINKVNKEFIKKKKSIDNENNNDQKDINQNTKIQLNENDILAIKMIINYFANR